MFNANVIRWHVSLLMLAESVSLSVTALPHVLATLGLAPGLLCMVVLGAIATFTGLILAEFKLSHPDIESFADVGQLIGGPIGREVLGFAQLMCFIFDMGAQILSFSIAMNVITGHSQCTILWSVVGLVMCFSFGLMMRLKHVSYLSAFGKLSRFVCWETGLD
jgi:amino acid permease